MDGLRKLLLAPALGLVVNGIRCSCSTSSACRSHVGRAGGAVLFAGAVALLWWSRETVGIRPASVGPRGGGTLEPRRSLAAQYLPFAAVLLAALVLTGRPMFLFGFDWVSFCNDDMANYCLGAHRVLDFGYFDQPDAEQLVRGRDYVQQMWFLHVPGMHRPGSEMILAFLCALTGQDGARKCSWSSSWPCTWRRSARWPHWCTARGRSRAGVGGGGAAGVLGAGQPGGAVPAHRAGLRAGDRILAGVLLLRRWPTPTRPESPRRLRAPQAARSSASPSRG
jgi:hypothetical protein